MTINLEPLYFFLFQYTINLKDVTIIFLEDGSLLRTRRDNS